MDLTAKLQKRKRTMEMKCHRKILRISYKDHVTNEEVCAKIQQAIGSHEDLLTIVKRHSLKWYGHAFRSSDLAKNYLARHIKRGKKTRQTEEKVGRQAREWTGLEFAKPQRAVENREKWRTLVVKPSVVPQ